ncbi:MAG TPA: hypothetical protein VN023_08750 [Methylovorus sp.]|jgi:hypothetical protein|nr:hypothetical protein [Methylovorus sp.]
MSHNQAAIEAIADRFNELVQQAFDNAYEVNDTDTTFSEFVEELFENIEQVFSEHVATEVLQFTDKEVESYNGGSGLYLDDIQPLLDDDEDDEEVEDDYDDETEH